MDKQQQPPPLPRLMSFAKTLSEHVLKIRTKNYKVWASRAERFQKGKYETRDPGMTASPTSAPILQSDRIKSYFPVTKLSLSQSS